MWKVLARNYKPTTVTRSSLKLSVLNDLVFKTVSYDLMTKKWLAGEPCGQCSCSVKFRPQDIHVKCSRTCCGSVVHTGSAVSRTVSAAVKNVLPLGERNCYRERVRT